MLTQIIFIPHKEGEPLYDVQPDGSYNFLNVTFKNAPPTPNYGVGLTYDLSVQVMQLLNLDPTAPVFRMSYQPTNGDMPFDNDTNPLIVYAKVDNTLPLMQLLEDSVLTPLQPVVQNLKDLIPDSN